MTAGEKDRLFAAAQTETTPELRLEAVRQLGAMGANDYLWQMYQKETSVDVKRQIISAMQVGGNVTRMIELAKTEKDPELRRTARPQSRRHGLEEHGRRARRALRHRKGSGHPRARSSTRSLLRATRPRSSRSRARSRTSR